MFLLLSLSAEPIGIYPFRPKRERRPSAAYILAKESMFGTMFHVLVRADDQQNLYFFLFALHATEKMLWITYEFVGYAMSGQGWTDPKARLWRSEKVPGEMFRGWVSSVRNYLGDKNQRYPVDFSRLGLEEFIPPLRRRYRR